MKKHSFSNNVIYYSSVDGSSDNEKHSVGKVDTATA